MSKELWEILVPASNNKDKEFTYEHHKAWDAFVKELTGGVTIMKTAKGQWVSPSGELYVDKMIPCRIACNRHEIFQIIKFTMEHYSQEAIMAYKVSDEVIIAHKDNMPEEYPMPEYPTFSRGTYAFTDNWGRRIYKDWNGNLGLLG